MAHPATFHDISKILDPLADLPRLGQALRDRAGLRDRLRETGEEMAAKFRAPRSEIESSFRARLRTAPKSE